MSGHLIGSGDDGAVARCAMCGAAAAGPCARCRKLVCADCCTLSHGGLTTFAVCTRCERRGGVSLRSAWLSLGLWIALLLLAIGGVAALLLLAR